MTLASDISTTSTSLSDIKNAIIAKGVTPSGNITTYAAAIANIPSGSSSGTRDVELTRIKDDSNNEIGTWFMNFADANGNEYKVVILDAQYRSASAYWCSQRSAVTDMPLYANAFSAWWYDNAKETATTNTQLILDFCTAGGYTSTACSHCRSQSFTINGTTYYGQLPNMREVFDMWRHRVQIEQMDTSASSHSSTNLSLANYIWSSSQFSYKYSWYFDNTGGLSGTVKPNNFFACPVLEIPA